jgi:hypothetical protein
LASNTPYTGGFIRITFQQTSPFPPAILLPTIQLHNPAPKNTSTFFMLAVHVGSNAPTVPTMPRIMQMPHPGGKKFNKIPVKPPVYHLVGGKIDRCIISHINLFTPIQAWGRRVAMIKHFPTYTSSGFAVV